MVNFNKNFNKNNVNSTNNNLDMQKMIEILSKMDKNQLEQGMAKAQEILKNKRDFENKK